MERVAVIGSGISGMAAAWLLDRRYDVHLFESADRLGGHTHTVRHAANGRPLDLDTGFIVYNERTYPLFTRLLDELEVASQASDMSFSISCRAPDFEYGTVGLGSLLAQPGNLLQPWYLGFLRDVVRFGRRGRALLAGPPDPAATVASFLADEGFGEAFGRFYLRPMVAAIWSSGRAAAGDFPRDTLLRFFANHGLLQVTGHPPWRTVTGGSRSYVERIVAGLGDRVRVGCGVARVERAAGDVTLHLADGRRERFDRVVIATHADQALALLAAPSAAERGLLGAWRYADNDTWLHTDTSLMPRRRRAWASWNYLVEGAAEDGEERACLSYHLNRLQRLDVADEFMVTLNPPRPPAADSVVRRMSYRHPVYERASVATQAELASLNGALRTWFCGAYCRNGFHEDGLWSAVRVAADLGVAFP